VVQIRLKKLECLNCKAVKYVIPRWFNGVQSETYKKIEKITGKIKLGGNCDKLCEWYCKKCSKYF